MITREQAEQALACIREQFKVYIDAGYPGPALIENWKPFVYRNDEVIDTEIVPFAVIWEEGPDEWVYRAKDGGVDEELSLLGREFREGYVARTPEASNWPEGVHASPYFSYALGLYEA